MPDTLTVYYRAARSSGHSSMPLSITWLGHSTFLLRLPAGQRIVTDPWLTNPNIPPAFGRPEALRPLDMILVSHGHQDHSADAAALARMTGAPVVCPFALGQELANRGVLSVQDMGIGGTQEVAGVRITMTAALHSGGAVGFVLRAPAMPTIYFAGDTGLFGDMKLIGEMYAPAIAFLPIGDHYTMGPESAAVAAQWLGVRQVVPMHWGTYPLLTGTPAALRASLGRALVDVLELKPGETAE
jgi:L-ascorbate metabolism protein UlaG (beta-lactamase superfamily)